jgi:hypothetical protein
MQRLVVSKSGHFTKVFGLPPIIGWLLAIAVFAAIFFLTRAWLRMYAVDQTLLQADRWNKDGVLMQGTKYTCVPASLVMLLKEQGISTDTYEMTERSGTNTEGTECGNIPKIGEHYGFKVTQKKLNYDNFMSTNLPAIVTFTWHDMFHAAYARVDKEKGYIVVKDPSVGLSTLDKKNWRKYFG